MTQSLSWQLFQLIEEDLKSIGQLAIENQEDGGLRRSYIRVFFSGVESILSALSDEVLSAHTQGFAVAKKDIAMLLDRKYSRDEDEILDQVSFTNSLDKLRLVVRLLAELRRYDYSFPNTQGWRNYRDAVSIRNRLTHPKKPEDYIVSIDDFEVVMLGKRWLKDELFGQLVHNEP